MAFNQTHDRIVAIPGGVNYGTGWTSAVYFADPGNNLVTTSITPPGTLPSAAHLTTGWYGRWQLVPSMDVYIAVPDEGVNAAILSLSPSDPTEAAPPSPPAGGSLIGGASVLRGVVIH